LIAAQWELSVVRTDERAAAPMIAPLMAERLLLDILPQPDDRTCGPTCLHAVYRYYGLELELEDVIRDVRTLDSGGTLAVLLANDALERGFEAILYTYNLQVFDPTWFSTERVDIAERLMRQRAVKSGRRLQAATRAYLEFLDRGGDLRLVDLTPALIRKYLTKKQPILTGLSSTFLYRAKREHGDDDEPDDIRGEPQGHFVVLAGYDADDRVVHVADPYLENPMRRKAHHYEVDIDRVIGSILLGVLTYDAVLLVVRPKRENSRAS